MIKKNLHELRSKLDSMRKDGGGATSYSQERSQSHQEMSTQMEAGSHLRSHHLR